MIRPASTTSFTMVCVLSLAGMLGGCDDAKPQNDAGPSDAGPPTEQCTSAPGDAVLTVDGGDAIVRISGCALTLNTCVGEFQDIIDDASASNISAFEACMTMCMDAESVLGGMSSGCTRCVVEWWTCSGATCISAGGTPAEVEACYVANCDPVYQRCSGLDGRPN